MFKALEACHELCKICDADFLKKIPTALQYADNLFQRAKLLPDICGFAKIRRSARGLFAPNLKYSATAKDIAGALFRERLQEIPKFLSKWWLKAAIY